MNSNTNQLNRNKNQTLIHKAVSTVEQENRKDSYTSFTEWYESAPKYLKDIFDSLKEFALSLGDDVTETTLKYYLALKKIKNFATMGIFRKKILINFKLNPINYTLTEKLRDLSDRRGALRR